MHSIRPWLSAAWLMLFGVFVLGCCVVTVVTDPNDASRAVMSVLGVFALYVCWQAAAVGVRRTADGFVARPFMGRRLHVRAPGTVTADTARSWNGSATITPVVTFGDGREPVAVTGLARRPRTGGGRSARDVALLQKWLDEARAYR